MAPIAGHGITLQTLDIILKLKPQHVVFGGGKPDRCNRDLSDVSAYGTK
jgi:hypothetical protein